MKDFAASLKKPRKAVILVKAGGPTDAVINELAAVFEPGDIIIDGGNALWTDTIRRERELKAKGLRFIGSGVSGGEEGARFGPSLMPGGDAAAWAELKPIWEAVASKVDAVTGVELTGATPGKPIKGGVPCVAHIGPDGAGHYVKMVHNGIEYGDMQMICEAYDLMRGLLGMTPDEIGSTFEEWNKGDLNSFLIEITAKVLKQKDPETGVPLVDVILDTAGQKGTGKWTSANALDGRRRPDHRRSRLRPLPLRREGRTRRRRQGPARPEASDDQSRQGQDHRTDPRRPLLLQDLLLLPGLPAHA